MITQRSTLQIAYALAILLALPAGYVHADSTGEVVMNSPGSLNSSGCVAVNSRYVSHVCMDKVTVRWKIGTLLNEPTINAAASWELWSRIGLRSDNTGSPDLMRAISTLKPETQAALRKLRPIQLQFGATVGITSLAGGFGGYGSRIGANPLKIRFDTGRMTLSGGGFSFNTTGSPGWDKFFFRSSAPSACPATAGQAAVREEAVSADEAKATLKNGLSLSNLVICKGDFAGLSGLDSVLGETCDAWQPGTQAHRQCLEKKEPKKEEPKKDTIKKEKKAADKPKPQEAKPTARLDNRQLAMLDKAVQKSVDRSSGGVKGDALDRALTQPLKSKIVTPTQTITSGDEERGKTPTRTLTGTWRFKGDFFLLANASHYYHCGDSQVDCYIELKQDGSLTLVYKRNDTRRSGKWKYAKDPDAVPPFTEMAVGETDDKCFSFSLRSRNKPKYEYVRQGILRFPKQVGTIPGGAMRLTLIPQQPCNSATTVYDREVIR